MKYTYYKQLGIKNAITLYWYHFAKSNYARFQELINDGYSPIWSFNELI